MRQDCYDIGMKANDVIRELQAIADPKRAKSSEWFFKTKKGDYGEGDKFIGIKVPDQRKVARGVIGLPLHEVSVLLKNPIHECRFTALEILVMQFESADTQQQDTIARMYLKHTKYINNWDLVDTSAPYIIGPWCVKHGTSILSKLARSKLLWERRIAIIATQHMIRNGSFADTIRIANILLHDKHDLIQKAVGWMLREVGNKDAAVLHAFLQRHASRMPRTMLRYAIEKFAPSIRKRYMTMKQLP